MVKSKIFPQSIESIESTAGKNYKQFSETTTMHGFLEFYTAKSWFWKIAWTIIIIGAFAITTYEVYKAVQDFMNHSTVSSIKPVDSDILYPPLGVCYIHWMQWVDWKKAVSTNFTRESLLYGLSFLSPIFSSTIFNVTEARNLFIEHMALEKLSTMSEFYKRIVKKFPMVTSLDKKYELVEESPYFNNITFVWKNPEIIFCYMSSGADLADGLTTERVNGPVFLPRQNAMFDFSMDDFKFPMVSDYVTYEEYNFYIAQWLHEKTNYWIITPDDYRKNFTLMPFPYRIYPDLYGDQFVEISRQDDFCTITMQLTVHRWLNSEKHPCQEGNSSIVTYDACREKCGAATNQQIFRYQTLDDAILQNNDTLDNLRQYKIYFLHELFSGHSNQSGKKFEVVDTYLTNISEMNNISNEVSDIVRQNFSICMKECRPACERWGYDFVSSVSTLDPVVRALSFKNQTNFRILYPVKENVLVIIEEPSHTWEDFLGNVGGLLGIWTGASILSFIQLLYLCCCNGFCCSNDDNDICCGKESGSIAKTTDMEQRNGTVNSNDINSFTL